MGKIGIKDIVNKNNKILVIMGILLTVLSLSFNFLKGINPQSAGYLSIVTIMAMVLLFLEIIPKNTPIMTIRGLMFLGLIGSIVGIIGYSVTKAYNQEYHEISNLAFIVASISIGALLGFRLFEKLTKWRKKRLAKNITFFVITLFIFNCINYIIKYIIELFKIIRLNKLIPEPFLIFLLGGFMGVIIFLGLFEVGYNRLIVKCLYPCLKKGYFKLKSYILNLKKKGNGSKVKTNR